MLAVSNLIIHSVYLKDEQWKIAYEFRGEWKPKTELLLDFLAQIEAETHDD